MTDKVQNMTELLVAVSALLAMVLVMGTLTFIASMAMRAADDYAIKHNLKHTEVLED